jgi:hypothetical protein
MASVGGSRRGATSTIFELRINSWRRDTRNRSVAALVSPSDREAPVLNPDWFVLTARFRIVAIHTVAGPDPAIGAGDTAIAMSRTLRRRTQFSSPCQQTQARRMNQTMATMTKINTTVPIPMYIWTHLSN